MSAYSRVVQGRARLLAVAAILVALVSATTALVSVMSGEAGPQWPPTAPAEVLPESEGATGDLPAPDFERVTAVGFARASSSLAEALDNVPFAPRLPGHIPGGLSLERFYLTTSAANEGTLELYYTTPVTHPPSPRPALHVWQTNRKHQAEEPAQKPTQGGSFVVAGNTWRYWLLPYPQPDGSVLELYAAEATMADGVSLSVDIRVGHDPTDAEREQWLSEIFRVIETLAPVTP